MFDGWLQFAGTEIINVDRTAEYLRRHAPSARFHDRSECEGLFTALEVLGWTGQNRSASIEYSSPLQDQPDWFDPNDRDTWGFYGLYPVSIEGLQDSTREATLVELSGDGSVAVGLRHGDREVRVSALAIGVDDGALDAGLAWLSSALAGSACAPGAAGAPRGDTLCYFASCPAPCCEDPESAQECLQGIVRQVHSVTTTIGPRVTKRYPASAVTLARVEFVMVAGDPFVWGLPAEVWQNPDEAIEPEVIGLDPESCAGDPAPAKILDPLCTYPPTPPRPPEVLDACMSEAAAWMRRVVHIPDEMIPVWGDAVPVVTIVNTAETAARTIRVRFYPSPFGRGLSEVNPCEFCGEMLVSYLPAGATLVIDGQARDARAWRAGESEQNALHLLFGSSGRPLSWPLLSCGADYWLTVDVADAVTDDLDISVQVVGRHR